MCEGDGCGFDRGQLIETGGEGGVVIGVDDGSNQGVGPDNNKTRCSEELAAGVVMAVCFNVLTVYCGNTSSLPLRTWFI